MNTYEATLKLIAPNEEGRKLNFKSPTVLKEILKHLENHNDKQSKQIKIISVTEHTLTVIMTAENVYRDGRDFTALSNILRNHGWLKYSSTNNLLTTTNFTEVHNIEFSLLPLIPEKDFNYIWANDVDKIMNNDQTIDLLKALFVLAETDRLTLETEQQKYTNCLFRVKEALFDAFN